MAMLAKDRHDNKYSPVAYAHRLRRIITQWCLRDFGIRSRVRKVSNLFEVARLTDEIALATAFEVTEFSYYFLFWNFHFLLLSKYFSTSSNE